MTKYEEDRKIRIIEEYIDGNEWIPAYSAFLISSISVSVKPFRLVYPHKLNQVPKVIEEITKKVNGKSNVEVDIKYFPIQIPTKILLSLLHDALIKKKARFNQIKNDPFKKEYEKQILLKQLEATINDIQAFINHVMGVKGAESLAKGITPYKKV